MTQSHSGIASLFTMLALPLSMSAAHAAEEPIQPTFSYQGELSDGGSPANGTYDFEMKLFDSLAGGAQLGPTEVFDDVAVVDGRFTVIIDVTFGANDGRRSFLEVGVRPGASGGGYTTLAPRQELTAAPSALTLRPGAVIREPVGAGSTLLTLRSEPGGFADGLRVETDFGFGIVASSSNNFPIQGTYSGSSLIPGVQGLTSSADSLATGVSGAVLGAGAHQSSAGVFGANQGAGIGVLGRHLLATGTAPGVKGTTASQSSNAVGVQGEVLPSSAGGLSAGVRGINNSTSGNGIGVHGSQAGSGWGVYGETPTGRGVYGSSTSGVAVYGRSGSGDIFVGNNVLGDVFRVDNSGNVTADGTYTSPAADFAELLPASGDVEAADVLVVASDGTLRRSDAAYDPAVAGVYSTRPGFLGGATGDNAGDIPLAVVGVVPVKVTNENGTVKPGDLLVASDVPGHAMRGGANPPNGTVIGKSLQACQARTGVVKAILMLQ